MSERAEVRGKTVRPKVSVAMITYNHEPYIAQAVESVMMQETSFPYELVIGEDASTDRSREIVEAMRRRFPDRIRLLPAGPNVGMNRNLVRTIEACRGEYVALLEGDDYWTAHDKLQRQVSFLTSNPGCAICCHAVLTLAQDGTIAPPSDQSGQIRPVSTLEDLLRRNFIKTCSVMFRARLFGEFPAWFYDLPWGDYPLNILNAHYGDIGYLENVMAIYREHAAGAWSGLSAIDQLERQVEYYAVLLTKLEIKHKKILQRALSTLHYRLGQQYASRRNWRQAQKHAVQALRLSPLNYELSSRRMAFLLRKPYTDCLGRLARSFFSARPSARTKKH